VEGYRPTAENLARLFVMV